MLKAVYEKQSDIPKGLEDHYKESDGKWVLDAEGMAPSGDLASLRAKVDEFRQNNVTLNEKIKGFDGKKVLSAEEQEEFARLIKQEEDIRDKKLIDSGKIDELLTNRTEKMRADFEAKIESLTTSLTEAKDVASTASGRLSKVMIRSEISKLLSDQGISPVKGAMDDIYTRAEQVWRASGENGALQAVKSNGDTIYGSEGKELTLAEWGSSLVKDAPFLFDANTGTGGEGGKKDIKTPDGVIRIQRGDEAAKSRNIENLATGKAVMVD